MRTTQRDEILTVLKDRYPAPVSNLQLQHETGLVRASARIGELQEAGWRIHGGKDGLGLSVDDGSQLYQLASLTQGPPRVKHVGITLTAHEGLSEVVRIHQGCSASPESLEALRQAVRVVYLDWESRWGGVDYIVDHMRSDEIARDHAWADEQDDLWNQLDGI